ncbi:MAG: VOC family protein [Thermoleophilia bacterium]|nr:VOC family protein [Thermoleophilia bacterium]MDH3725597.1 VOC family protein [Thermoleophilia bacterium]
MPERTEYAPGTPSWVDLSAADLDAARAFYSRVFGWKYRDEAAGEGSVHSVAQVDGKAVAGLWAAGDSPPGWNTYVTVQEVDGAVSAALAAGASTALEPVDAEADGRMARIVDAVGAQVSLWEPRKRAGAELVSEPGGFIWTELLCGDCARAAEFYGSLFGWEAEAMPAPDGSEAMLFAGREGPVASVRDPKSSLPPTWLVYFACEDADACAAAVADAGGAIAIEPIDAPFGRMGAAVDVNGAAFAFIATNPEYELAA